MANNDFYELFASSVQDGYLGGLIEMVKMIGGEEKLYHISEDELKKHGFTSRMTKHIINRRNSFDYDETKRIMEQKNIKFLRFDSPEFPSRLSNIPSCPYGVFVRGCMSGDDEPAVAIVGARNCSDYGRLMAEYFGDRLARKGINIISGMAYGIDGISQMAAMDAGGKSYGVLGCGVDVIYPAGNRKLYDRLINGGGGVISEYLPGTQAIGRNFPPRNRIISGLCDVLLVVEARAKSGTLITVDMAVDQGRDVCVVPGRITDPLSMGCLNLVRGGAYPVVSPDEVEELLTNIKNEKKEINKKINNNNLKNNNVEIKNNIIKNKIEKQESPAKELIEKQEISEKEKQIMDSLDYYPRSCEEIALRSDIDISEVMVLLTKLEIKELVVCHSQGCFSKKTMD